MRSRFITASWESQGKIDFGSVAIEPDGTGTENRNEATNIKKKEKKNMIKEKFCYLNLFR
jgi:uncharacterized protein YrzB (UPF0473 family)